MKNILYKELKLALHPVLYLFALTSALLLAPGYPYAVGMIYFIFGVQILFQTARANKDLEFTATLPVPRAAIVLSKHLSVMLLEILQLLIAVPFALVSSLVLNKGGNAVGLDANFALFGVTLAGYSVFNLVFLPLFYKTGYKLGVPFVLGIISYGIFAALVEIVIANVPALKSNLDSLNPDTFVYQIPLLFAGILIYTASLYLSYKVSVKNFEKISL